MTRFYYWLLAAILGSFACGGSLAAPSPIPQAAQPAADVATISGRIYANDGSLYPPIRDALIEVNEADGTSGTVVTDAEGFYRISARRGSVTITASREGYEAKQWQFDLLNDMVLNFSLSPR
jgi:FlaG/FlaF family flagellin (archaellin)